MSLGFDLKILKSTLTYLSGLLSELFGELYDGFIIQKESLYKWRDSKDQSAGKGIYLIYIYYLLVIHSLFIHSLLIQAWL